MLSVPSFELLPSSNEKQLDSPSALTATSFNDQLEELSLERPAKEDRMTLWRSAEQRVLEWFACRDISIASPEELISAHKHQQRRLVSYKKNRGDFRIEEVLIKRRLGRKLTIDIWYCRVSPGWLFFTNPYNILFLEVGCYLEGT